MNFIETKKFSKKTTKQYIQYDTKKKLPKNKHNENIYINLKKTK